MGWQSCGLIYEPPGQGGWRHQFGMLPTPHVRQDGTVRLFLGFCDESMVGRVGFVDLDPDAPTRVLRTSAQPVLDIGRPGAFDDNGVVPISLVRDGSQLRLYYIGFQLGRQVPYFMFCGLAVSTDDGDSFERVSEAPVLDRNSEELFARCGCHVMRDGDRWRMWYVGSLDQGWVERDGKPVPLYTVRHVTSVDGIHWTPEVGTPVMDFANADEHGFGRPFVRRQRDGYEMLLSVRTYSRGYYLARALSPDGVNWTRDPGELDITRGAQDGWASDSTSYAHTLTLNGQDYLFFNGNGCGKSGVGVARWDPQ